MEEEKNNQIGEELKSESNQEQNVQNSNIEKNQIQYANDNTKNDSKKKNTWWICLLSVLTIIIIVLLLLLLRGCGNGNKYKIKIHNGNEIIEVDKNFKLSDLEVEGGKVSFLVDSEGNVIDPSDKLDPKMEYSTHVIPDGKEKVKVTYINGNKKFSIEYQKGAGLLVPKVEKKKGYIFLGWKDEETNNFPKVMTPVMKDMTLVAQFVKPSFKGGACLLNCDTNGDNKCDLNCDTNGDGTPDKNIDTDGDGIPDSNIDTDGDDVCDIDCIIGVECLDDCDSDIQFINKTNSELNFSCKYTDPGVVIKGVTKDMLVSATLDGKKIEPDSYVGDFPRFDLIEYYNSGSTHEFVAQWIRTDQVGQKYYITYTTKLVFASNCDTKTNNDSEVVNIVLDRNNHCSCKNFDNGFGVKTSDAIEQGLVLNENSQIKVVDSKLVGDTDTKGFEFKCSLNNEYVSWGYKYTNFDNVKAFVESRRGNTYTDTCVFEVITDGKKYNVTLNVTTLYDKACSNDNNNQNNNNHNSVTYTCPDGYTLSGTKCSKTVTDTKAAKTDGYTCDSGYTLSDNKCVKYESATCPSDYTDTGTGCSKEIVSNVIYSCETTVAGSYAENGKCFYSNGDEIPGQIPIPSCPDGSTMNATGDKCISSDYFRKSCPGGANSQYTDNGLMCEKTVDASIKYSCSSYGTDYKLDGNKCKKTVTETINATKK